VEQRGNCRGLMASQADTHTTRYHRRARHRHRQVPTEEGGGTTEASKPTRLSCQTASLFIGVDQSHQGGARREVGRGKLSRPHGLPGCNSRPAATTFERSTFRRPL
jgi:hypothetical protein